LFTLARSVKGVKTWQNWNKLKELAQNTPGSCGKQASGALRVYWKKAPPPEAGMKLPGQQASAAN
jgi:hypothetical protein